MTVGTGAALLDDRRAVVVAGPPRSGSTTVSAALGLAAARRGGRVLVVSVDPSADLETALGTMARGEPRRTTVGIEGRGELWSERFDVASTFRRLVEAVSDDEATAAEVVENPLYETLTASLPGAADFMAPERLVQLAGSGDWDLVVLDTRSSTPAAGFLTAPERVRGFLGHPVYRALTLGQRTFGKMADAALSSFLGDVRKVAGPEVADDTVAFFRSIARLEAGLRRRLDEAVALLDAPTTGFVAVTSVRPEAVAETEAMLVRVGGRPDPATVVANRVAAPTGDDPWAEQVARESDELVRRLSARRGAGSALEVPDLGIGPADLAMFGAVGDALSAR